MSSDPPSSADPPAGLDPSRLDIETRQPTLEELLRRIRDGECDLGPEDDATDAWTVTAKSRLVESILIRVPLPAFFVDAADEERWVVIDGRRRLAALRDFVSDKSFALTDLEYLTELEGQGCDDLARALKRRLNETQITVELIKPGTPMAIRRNLYRRVNPRWSVQDVRDAVIRGAAGALIDALAGSEPFREAAGEGGGREAILRFLAFFPIAHPPDCGPSLETFLDRAMEDLGEDSLDGMMRRHLLGMRFDAAMGTATALFGDGAFRAPGEEQEGPGAVNPALFETWSVILARLDPTETERLIARREEVIKAFTELLHDQGFVAATAPGIDDSASVRARFSAIHDLVGQFVNA